MRNALAVFCGGMIGGIGRALFDQWLGGPVATLLVNLTGAFFLAFWTARWLHRWQGATWVNLAVGTGAVGAWTTFSTMTTTTVAMLKRSLIGGLAYLMVMLAGGLILAGLGRYLGRGRQS